MKSLCLLIVALVTLTLGGDDNERNRLTLSERTPDIRGFEGQQFEVKFEFPENGYNVSTRRLSSPFKSNRRRT